MMPESSGLAKAPPALYTEGAANVSMLLHVLVNFGLIALLIGEPNEVAQFRSEADTVAQSRTLRLASSGRFDLAEMKREARLHKDLVTYVQEHRRR